jgi:hypothetical protein
MTRWYQLRQATPVARVLADASATARRDDRTGPGDDANGSYDERKQADAMATRLDPAIVIGPAGRCFDIDSAIDGEPAWLSYLASGPNEVATRPGVQH